MPKGWKGESARHSAAARGIPTRRYKTEISQLNYDGKIHDIHYTDYNNIKPQIAIGYINDHLEDMDELDFEAFAGAELGSKIFYCEHDGNTYIMSPSGRLRSFRYDEKSGRDYIYEYDRVYKEWIEI